VVSDLEVSVTRKGQVTIPVKYRRKYGIKEGAKMVAEDTSYGIVFKPIPRLEDLAEVDSGKYNAKEMKEALDRVRERWR